MELAFTKKQTLKFVASYEADEAIELTYKRSMDPRRDCVWCFFKHTIVLFGLSDILAG